MQDELENLKLKTINCVAQKAKIMVKLSEFHRYKKLKVQARNITEQKIQKENRQGMQSLTFCVGNEGLLALALFKLE